MHFTEGLVDMRVTRILAGVAVVCAMTATPTLAATIMFGSGSAVTTVDAAANFEDVASLGATYTEDGLDFARVGLSLNNNGCGYAGCAGSFPGFTGNYMYGVSFGDDPNAYLSIRATGTNVFEALELNVGSGFGMTMSSIFKWEILNQGTSLATGSFAGSDAGAPIVLGVSESLGFDEFRLVVNHLIYSQVSAPAFDNVSAQYLSATAVPEPTTILLLSTGLIGVAVRRRYGHG